MGTDAPPGGLPIPHTSTDEWQSFETRMRQRRIERLLARAQLAHAEGRDDEARAALVEAEELGGDPIALYPAEHQFEEPPFIEEGEEDESTAASGLQLHYVETGDEGDEDEYDLPLYPVVSVPHRWRASKGSRIAGMLTACVVIFWFGGPQVADAPSQLAVEAPPEVATNPALSGPASPVAPDPVAQSAANELPAVRLSVTDVSADTIPVDGNADAPAAVSLAGLARLDVTQPQATSPEPATRPADPAATRVDSSPTSAAAPSVAIPSAPPVEVTPSPMVASAAPPSIEPPPVATLPTPDVAVAVPPAAPPTTAPPTPTPAPAPAREAEAAAPPAVPAAAVRAALMQYESAYSRLDADAAGAVWPTLDRKALARAFDGLASQRVNLGSCEMRIVGESATAECTGSTSWTPKVGGRSHNAVRRWQFRLKNADPGWQIVSATVR
jgi:hypothetical protein